MNRNALAASALAVALTTLSSGCEDDAGTVALPLVLETFEDACGELPCEWAQIAGAPGAVSRVTAVHPGVHALRLEGDGAAAAGTAQLDGLGQSGGFSRGPTLVYDPPPYEAPLAVTLTGVCAPGSSLELAVVATVAAPSIEAPESASVPYVGALEPADEWTEPAEGELTPSLDGIDPPPPAGALVLTAETVAVALRGPGPCDLARLVVAPLD